ncbi:MAG: CPBP family intramembrane metalloprotease [Dehalococcoidia bacterium]|nr:MAG: CPBP family intramembrane metalloprotease [Dehalococcoidia bacterium]
MNVDNKTTKKTNQSNSEIKMEGRDILLFFALTIAWTYLFWGLRAVILNDVLSLGVSPDALKFIGGFGPTIIAIVLTHRKHGKDGVISLLRRGLDHSFAKKWWIPLIFFTTLVTFTAYQLVKIVTPIPDITQFNAVFSSFSGFIGGLFILLLISIAEEFGWRGYALDRLQAEYNSSKYTAIISSIVLGLVWAFWHLPLFFTPGEGKSFEVQYFPYFLVMTILLAVSLTWLHNNTNGSILAAIIFHASVNFSGIVVPVTRSYAVPSNLGYLALDSVVLVVTTLIVMLYGVKKLVRDSHNHLI